MIEQFGQVMGLVQMIWSHNACIEPPLPIKMGTGVLRSHVLAAEQIANGV